MRQNDRSQVQEKRRGSGRAEVRYQVTHLVTCMGMGIPAVFAQV